MALGIFGFYANDRFTPERTGRPHSWVVCGHQAIRSKEVSGICFFKIRYKLNGGHDRTWHRSTSNAVCHGSLPVYVSRTSSSFYGETPTIPPLARQSTLAPTFISGGSPVLHPQPKTLPHVPEQGTQSKLPQSRESFQTSEPSELPQSSRLSQQSAPFPDSVAFVMTLADSISPTSSVGRASSYQTCEEESTGC